MEFPPFCLIHHNVQIAVDGGERGIRTLDGLAPIPVFETGAFNHSATSPCRACCSHLAVS